MSLSSLFLPHGKNTQFCLFCLEQKRDIQLLKAYMRAIRSANPNLQNLEESIEYNEILESVSVLSSSALISVPLPLLTEILRCPALLLCKMI